MKPTYEELKALCDEMAYYLELYHDDIYQQSKYVDKLLAKYKAAIGEDK